jgi:membrane protease YdiL (CAAX protease family)
VAITALVAAFTLLVGGAIAVVLWYLSQGTPLAELGKRLPDELQTPPWFIFFAALGQFAILATPLAAAWLSPVPMKLRLGLGRPRLSVGSWIVVVLASLVPFGVGIGLAYALTLVLAPDSTIEALYTNMTPDLVVPWVLFIALAPAFSEEILFRGYIQRRLLLRMSPMWAIFISSLVFALFHIQPHTILFALPLGVWLGVVAWRTGSIWPGIITHAAINGGWNIYQCWMHLQGIEEQSVIAIVVLGVIGLAALAAAVPILRRHPSQPAPVEQAA